MKKIILLTLSLIISNWTITTPVIYKDQPYEIVNLASSMTLNTRWEDRD